MKDDGRGEVQYRPGREEPCSNHQLYASRQLSLTSQPFCLLAKGKAAEQLEYASAAYCAWQCAPGSSHCSRALQVMVLLLNQRLIKRHATRFLKH